MLSENVREWTAEWVAEGRAKGLEQGRAEGIEQGRAEERALLCRQAARKFDDDARRLAAVLAEVADPERLAQVGDWIIECGTEAELFARVAEVHGAGAQRSAAVLAEVADPERLTQAGGGIVECATGAEPFAPVAEARWSPTEVPLRMEDVILLVKDKEKWKALWVAEGCAEGLEQGREQGREQVRVEKCALLCRQAARKFDDDTQRLAAVLAEVTDPKRLAEVGDWIIDCGTEAELFARVADARRPGTEAPRLGTAQTRIVEQVWEWLAEWAANGRAEGLEQGREQGLEQGREQGLEQGREQGLEQGRAEGLEQGREQGLEQGRSEERALLCRLAARKFDAGAPQRLAAALAEVADPERLAEVGDWIIECGTEAELLTRVARFGS